MQTYVPHYLGKEVIGDSTAFEVGRAQIDRAAVFVNKALTDDEVVLAMLPETEIAGKWYSVKMAGSDIDRHRERFSVAVLEKYARDINAQGSTFNFGHSSDNLIGKVSKAEVVDGNLNGYVWVDELAVMPNQPKMSVNHAIAAGIIKEVSVEVSGQLRAIKKNEEGWATEWEFFFDETNPNATEFHGLALVKRGAQRGAALSVKALDGQTNPDQQTSNSITINMKEVLLIDGVKYYISAKVEGSEIVAEGLNEIDTAVKDLEGKAAKSVNLEADILSLKAEIEALRAPFVADIINGQKSLEVAEPLTEEAIKAFSHDTLIAKANATTDAVKALEVKSEEAPKSFKKAWEYKNA